MWYRYGCKKERDQEVLKFGMRKAARLRLTEMGELKHDWRRGYCNNDSRTYKVGKIRRVRPSWKRFK